MEQGNLKLLQWILAGFFSLIVMMLLWSRFEGSIALFTMLDAWKPPILSALVLSFVGNVVFAAWQWRAAYAQVGIRSGLGEQMYMKTAVYGLRLLPPIRHGAIGRSLYLSRTYQIHRDRGDSAAAVVAWVNVLIMAIFSVFGLLSAGSVIGAFGCFLLAGAVAAGGPALRNAILRGVHENKPKDHWMRSLARFVPVTQLPRGAFWTLFFYGCLSLFTRIVAALLAARAIGLSIPLRDAVGLIPLIILMASLPVSFFGLGMRELLVFLVFSGAGPGHELLAWGLLMSLIDQLPIVIPGLVTMVPFIYSCRFDSWPTPN